MWPRPLTECSIKVQLTNLHNTCQNNTLKSYITDRYFRVKQEEPYSELKEIRAGVPQGSVLGPALYLLYTCDIPTIEIGTIATFADDTAILTVGETIKDATENLQISVNRIHEWTRNDVSS